MTSSSSLCSTCCLLLKEKTQHVSREWMQYRYVTVVCVSVHLLAVLQYVLLSTADRQFVPVSLRPARRDLDSWAWNTWEQQTAQSLLQQNMSVLVSHLEFCWSVSPHCQFYSSRKKGGNSEVVLYEHCTVHTSCAHSAHTAASNPTAWGLFLWFLTGKESVRFGNLCSMIQSMKVSVFSKACLTLMKSMHACKISN